MYKILFSIIIFTLIVFSVFAEVKKPSMHNIVQIYDAKYAISNNLSPKEEEKITKEEEKSIPTQENKIIQKEDKNIVERPQKTTQTAKMPQETIKIKKENKKNEEKKTVTKVEEKTKNIIQEAPKTIKQETKTQDIIEKEELIAWNTWHSNIQNKLMQDVKMPPMPDGIIFKFTFTVDRYGKITNINTYSTDPKYTPYAVEYIAPVIRSYQGKSILDFPKNSNRTTTEFKGGWKMSNTTRLSSPNDYNDVEKIKK